MVNDMSLIICTISLSIPETMSFFLIKFMYIIKFNKIIQPEVAVHWSPIKYQISDCFISKDFSLWKWRFLCWKYLHFSLTKKNHYFLLTVGIRHSRSLFRRYAYLLLPKWFDKTSALHGRFATKKRFMLASNYVLQFLLCFMLVHFIWRGWFRERVRRGWQKRQRMLKIE